MPGEHMETQTHKMMLANAGGLKAMPSHVVKSLGKISKWSSSTPRQLLANLAAPGPQPLDAADAEATSPTAVAKGDKQAAGTLAVHAFARPHSF